MVAVQVEFGFISFMKLKRKLVWKELLQTRDRTLWRAQARKMRDPFGTLLSLTYEPDDLIRWRAIEAIGILAGELAGKDLERIRELIRRQFWLMNDESGGLNRSAPEIIAEILVNVPPLSDEFSGFLVSYLNEEPFEISACRAIARIAEKKPELEKQAVPALRRMIHVYHNQIASYALYALRQFGASDDLPEGSNRPGVFHTVIIYDPNSGQVQTIDI